MRIPAFAEGTLSDLLEQRLDTVEELLLDVYKHDPRIEELKEARVFYESRMKGLEGNRG